MELLPILLQQLITMIIYMAIGYVLFKISFVTEQGCKEMGNLLLYVILPAVLFQAYCVERTAEKTKALLLSFALSLAALLLSMLITSLLYRRKKIERFGTAFSNAGFMGIPIVSAVLGTEAVFYISSFVALLNVLQWTYGIAVMTDSLDCIKVKRLIKNPIILAVIVGIIAFFIQPPIPALMTRAISSLAALNGPMAMIILGIYLAQTDIKSIFTSGWLYYVSAVRLLLVPVATGLFLLLIPADPGIKLAILVVASASVGSNVTILAQMHGLDYTLAAKEVCLTTLLCVVTMPLVVTLFSVLF